MKVKAAILMFNFCFSQSLALAVETPAASVTAIQTSPANNFIKIEIKIKGMKSEDGQVLALLFSSAAGFPDKVDKAMQKVLIPAKKGDVDFAFLNLNSGEYAITVVHDENKNGKLETNWIGMPKEGIGVSKDAEGNFGPPSYSAAKIKFDKDSKIQITMNYL